MEVLVAICATWRRKYDLRPPPEKPHKPGEIRAEWRLEMKKKLESDEGKAKYRLRKQTIEPVFGIIKSVLGFRRFSLRGIKNVKSEWKLVTLAYNCKKMAKMLAA